MSRHWAAIDEAGAVTGLRIMVWIHSHLGRVVFNIVLVPVMAYFFVRRGVARRASMDFLRKVEARYPGQIGRGPVLWLSFRHFFVFGQALLDKCITWIQPPTGINMSPGAEDLHASVLDSGQGVLLIGSHFGNLDYLRSLAVRHPNLVINVLHFDQHAAKFAALMSGSASKTRMNMIQVTDLNLELALRLKEKVERGEWLLLAGDRIPVGSSGKVCATTFFGEQANFPIGPYVLAHLMHCPVYLLHCFRRDGEYYLDMKLFAKEIQPPREKGRRSYDREVQKFAAALEAQVRHDPLQWFNFYDFWGQGDTSQPQTDRLRADEKK